MLLLLLSGLLAGCRATWSSRSVLGSPESLASFANWYSQVGELGQVEGASEEPGVVLTLSASGVPLHVFARDLADRAGVSVVVEEALDHREVTMELRAVTVEAAFALLARRLGVEVTAVAGVWYVGELRPEDRAVLVRRVVRLGAQELAAAVGVALSPNGRVQAFTDGMLVLADRVEVLQRIEGLLDRLEALPADVWLVQLHLVGVRESEMRSLGLDVVPSLDVAATFAAMSGAGVDGVAQATGGLQAVLAAAERTEAAAVVAAPLFLLSDGGSGRMVDGDELRLPEFTVSNEGTVTQTGFERISTGLEVEVSVRDVGGGRARLELDLSLSSVTAVGGEVGGPGPTVNRQELQTGVVVTSGGVYLLGALERSSRVEAVEGIARLWKGREESERVVQVWARVMRVGEML